jgi:hypothetical protein
MIYLFVSQQHAGTIVLTGTIVSATTFLTDASERRKKQGHNIIVVRETSTLVKDGSATAYRI